MADKELKVRIGDLPALHQRLEELGATAGETLHVLCKYFRQPAGQVLKLSTDDHGSTLTHLEATADGFDLLSNETVPDATQRTQQLDALHGRKSQLSKEETLYTLPSHDFRVLLVSIPQVGDFAVIVHPHPTVSMAVDTLGLRDPQIITVPFDELPPANLTVMHISGSQSEKG